MFVAHMNLLILFLFTSLATFALTYLLKTFLLSKDLLVFPNDRSSHKKPTPQSGGLAIVLISISLFFVNDLNISFLLTLAVPGILVAITGLADDLTKLSTSVRLITHFLAAILGLYMLEGLPPILFFGNLIDLGIIGNVLAVIYIVWMINLYNFMDGIDGLASLEAIFVFLSMSVLLFMTFYDSNLYIVLAFFGFSSLGFLFLNFPKPRIFLGDVGSGFLGVILAIISLEVAKHSPQAFWSFLILLGVFLVDATYTLIRRVLNGEKFYEAHSLHAYQKLARSFNSHNKVSIIILLLNMVWLLPIAILVAFENLEGIVGLVIAYLPLVLISYFSGAGVRNTS